MVQVKTEKPDDNPVPKAPEAEEPATEPPVSITLQRATPEPEPQPAQEPATPAPKAKSGSLLDDLLRRQLSPITPLPLEEVNKLKPKKVFDPKKYADALQDDEDDVVPAKRLAKRPVRSSPRISRGGSQDSATIAKDKGASKKGSIGTPAEKGSKGLLKLSKRKGDNLAATRIKKRKTTRKVLKSEEEDTPPLKKASMRPRSSTLTVSAKASKVGLKQEETSSPTRKPRGRPKKKRPEWPEPLPVTPDALQPMIKCDGCSVWFHYSCVAIHDDDVRLKDDEIFYCPACTAGVALSRKNMQKDPSDSADQVCGRPECKIETSYFLTKFVGRRRVLRNSALVPQYLVKWEGWRLASATWENLQDLGIDNPEEYVETLEKELQDQDVDINKDENEYNVVLLQQAKDAGWCPNGGYNPKWRAPHYDSADDLEYDDAP
ncbi:hypothetical protein BJ165DRAFT_25854 [Panaeolus papilionaceus]|nr:hypothetical protein BJ165DRAFT_25854 [Panaeolus papilionaceus]